MTQGDLFSASAAIPPQISSQLPLTEGLPSIIDVIAQVSTRPRYAFMVLNLIARAAGQGGRAGPYVVQQGRAVRLAGPASAAVLVTILARRREPPRPHRRPRRSRKSGQRRWHRRRLRCVAGRRWI